MTPEIRAQVIESRRRQGLPDTIQDPVFLTKLAAILCDDMIPGAGSSLGTAPTGTSAGRRAPGRVMEPAPVSHTEPNGVAS